MSEKTYKEKSYHQLNRNDLLAHAEDLSGETALEALDYIGELAKTLIPYTDKMKNDERKTLSKKYKRKRVEVLDENEKPVKNKDGSIKYEWIKTNERIYTDNEIENMLNAKTEVLMPVFTQKRKYCEKYWEEIVPQKADKDETELADKIAAAKARVKAASGKK